MGNCFAGRKHLVHPSEPYGPKDSSLPSGAVRVKVRMTAARFKDLVSQADLSKGDGEVGRLILQECLKGACHARFIGGHETKGTHGKVRSLEAITEEE